MPHPLHNFKINGKMNFFSLKPLFNISLNLKGMLCLLLFLGVHLSIEAQTFANPIDTIEVILPSNDNKGVVTGQQLHDALNPSALLFFDNINSQDSMMRDTNYIPDNNAQILFVGCDTATYIGDNTQLYGLETDIDTLANLSVVTFFTFANEPGLRRDSLVMGVMPPTDANLVGDPVLTGTGTSVTAVFKIVDNTPPVAMCNGGTSSMPDTVYLDASGFITAAQLDAGSIDNCTTPNDLVFSISQDTIRCDSIGQPAFEVVLTVTDEAGNSSTCPSFVVVKDTLGPTFPNVPPNDTLACTDAIPPQVTLMPTDICSTVDSIWMDTISTRPTLTTLADGTLRGTMTMPDTITMDSLVRDSAFYNFDLTYLWFARDGFGNFSSVQQVISIRDTTPPTIGFDTLILAPTNPSATTCSGDVILDLATNVTDACSDSLQYLAVLNTDMSVIDDTSDVVTLNVLIGDTTIYIVARDFSNNVSMQQIRIEVDDRTDPVPRCNNAVAITINAFGFAVIDSSVININSIDNCTSADDLRFQLSRDSFTCADIGQVFPVTMTVIDESGNQAFCQSNITVQDFAGTGAFSCPPDVTIDCDDSISHLNTGEPTRMDVCGGVSNLQFSDNVIAGSGINNICQIIERTWTLTDANGAVTTCLQMISLVDSVAPVLTASFPDTIVDCLASGATADSILVTDNCVDSYFAHAVDSFSIAMDTITLRRIWTAFDSCTIVADTQFIKVVDNMAPVISLPADTSFFTSAAIPDSCGVLVNFDFSLFVTDCNASLGLTIGYNGQDSTAIFSQFLPIGSHEIIVSAMDSSGNTGLDTLTVNVIDDTRPTLVCVTNLNISLGTGGTGILSISDVLSSVQDNCGDTSAIDTIFLSQTIFDCSDLGLNQVTLTAIDTAGNSSTCIANVAVVNQGTNNFIQIQTGAVNESVAGANDGMAGVVVSGGSGSHTVAWSPGGGTTDTISNLAPGLYTVVVNDPVTGCILTDTVSVGTGNAITYVIGTAQGTPGSIVQIPVTVTNFNNVVSANMAFSLSSSVGQFVPGNLAGGFNVPGLVASDFSLDPNNSNLLLLDAVFNPVAGESLPNGSQIFYINVQLAGMAGDMVSLTASGNTGTNPMTGILINNSPVDLVATVSSGSALVVAQGTAVNFSGNVSRVITGDPLEGVLVTLNGATSTTDSTDVNGDYTFTVPPNQGSVVIPTEDRNHRQGLTVTDLALIQAHILGTPLADPYQVLAADVNNSKTITVTDLALIQAVILGNIPAFPAVPSWRFVPAGFVPISGSDSQILNQPLPDSIAGPTINADFIGFKMGDANLSASSVTFTSNEIASSRSNFYFGVEDAFLKEGEIVEVPFKAKQFTDMFAYQMTLEASPEWLTFESVEAGALTDVGIDKFGLSKSSEGLISALWYNAEPLSIEQNTTLFTISFRVNKGGKYLSDILRASSEIIPAEAHVKNENPQNISLTFDTQEAISGFELHQNRPNPFGSETAISFSLPKAMPASLRFFDFSGRMVHQIHATYEAGLNNIVIQRNELAGSGVIYYELSTPIFTARKKMIVLE